MPIWRGSLLATRMPPWTCWSGTIAITSSPPSPLCRKEQFFLFHFSTRYQYRIGSEKEQLLPDQFLIPFSRTKYILMIKITSVFCFASWYSKRNNFELKVVRVLMSPSRALLVGIWFWFWSAPDPVWRFLLFEYETVFGCLKDAAVAALKKAAPAHCSDQPKNRLRSRFKWRLRLLNTAFESSDNSIFF